MASLWVEFVFANTLLVLGIGTLVQGHMGLYLPIARSTFLDNGTCTGTSAGCIFNDCGFRKVRWDFLQQENFEAEQCGKPKNFYAGTNCGPCGDDITFTPPRLREAGYPGYDRWPLTTYRQNTSVDFSVGASNPHGGYCQFRIGEDITLESDTDINVAQENFKYLLNVTAVRDNYYPPPALPYQLASFDPSTPNQFNILPFERPIFDLTTNGTTTPYATVTVTLPELFVSDHTSLQFNYVAGRGCPNPNECYQQTFRSCADIRIVPQNDYTFLQNKKSGKCLGQSASSLIMFDCPSDIPSHGSPPPPVSVFVVQPWANYASRSAFIIIEKTGQCIEVYQGSMSNDAPVNPYNCKAHNRQNQEWGTVAIDSNYFRIQNSNSGLFLNAGIAITQRTSNATSDCQIWSFYFPNNSLYGPKVPPVGPS